jgi:hypothetical protein
MEKLAIGLSLVMLLYVSIFFISGYMMRFRESQRPVRMPGLFKKANPNHHDHSNSE